MISQAARAATSESWPKVGIAQVYIRSTRN